MRSRSVKNVRRAVGGSRTRTNSVKKAVILKQAAPTTNKVVKAQSPVAIQASSPSPVATTATSVATPLATTVQTSSPEVTLPTAPVMQTMTAPNIQTTSPPVANTPTVTTVTQASPEKAESKFSTEKLLKAGGLILMASKVIALFTKSSS